MAINKKLIHFETLAKFQSADGINTTSATQTPTNDLVGNIPYHSIVFIKDSCKFWTHGKYYDCNNTWRGILNNLTSTSTTDSLSAYQGKILNEKFANYLSLSGGTLTGALSVPSLTVTGASTFSQAINGSILGNAATASRLLNARTINGTSFDGSVNITTANWGTARNISIADSDSTNTGTAVSVNGSAAVTLKLPATIKATLSGNATSATKATNDSDGNAINTTYLKKSGGTMSGTLIISGITTDNWVEGIRINNASNGWTTLLMGGTSSTGTSTASWSFHTYLNNFYLAHNGSSSFDQGISCVSNSWNIKGSGLTYNSNTIWHAGNDGSGSGLDADKLDGQEGSYYATASSLGSYVTLSTAQTISGNKTFSSSVSIDDLTAGNLVVTGAASFALTINGNASTANKVNHTLTFTGGVTGTFDGSADKSVAIPTKSSWNYDDVYLKLSGGVLSGSAGQNAMFVVDSTNSVGPSITLRASSTVKSYWGYYPSGGYTYLSNEYVKAELRIYNDGTFKFTPDYSGSNTYTVYHTGNLSPMTTSHPANSITSTNISNWNTVYDWLTTTTSDTDATINKWHELEAFLTSITESDTLSGLLASRVAKSGDTMTGALTTPGLTVTGASTFSLDINGSILGNAATASRLQNVRNIAISGAVTGNANFDGSGNITISTSVNHTHAYFPYQYIWGDSLTSAVNLNTITDSLKFVTVSWSYAGYLNVTNSPWSSSAGNVFHLGGEYPMQIASFYNTSTDVYIRTYYSGNGWKDWKKIAFAGEAQPANGGNADTLNGLESGVINGSVSVFVPWPGNQTMKDEGLMPSEYGTSGYGYPDEVYLKSICKWAIAHYTNQGDVTLIGSIAPNSSGTCILHLYSSSGRDSSTLLPRYCSGTYTVLSGYIYNFGTIDYNWYYRQVSAGYASSAGSASSATQLQTSRSIWGQSFDGTGDVYGDMSNVGWINSVVSIGYQGNARLYIQGVSDNLDYLKMNVSDSNATQRHLILQDYGGNIAIGTTSPETKLDVNGIQQIYARGLDNSAFKDLLLLKAQHSSEPSADAWDASYPTFGIGFRRYWTSGNDPYGETTCAGIYATESASWRGGLVFRTKNNQTQGGTHDISALRLAPSGFAIFENNNLWLTPARLQIGRPDSTAYTDRACIGVTDGNLHIDPYSGHSLFLNYYNHATTYFGGSSYYISSDGSYYNGTAAAAGDSDTVDTYHASDFVYRKNSTNVYNFIGSSQYSSSGWYKVTFPHANTTTDVSTYWFMLSMDVIFGGSYNYGPNGKVRLSYYFSRAVNSYATSVGNVYGVAFGNDLGPIRICYDPNDSGYMYVYNGGLYYATIAIKNLTITDNGQQYEYLNTVIEPCSAPSGVTDVTINKIYSNAGGGMLLNGSPLIHSSNIGWEWSNGVTYDPHTRRFTWSKSTNDWDALFYSRDGYFDDIGISFKPGQTGSYVMVGLNTDPTSNASYSSIDYCWYCTGSGTVHIYESGSYIGDYGAYSVGDEFTIIYSAKQIKYYWNGVVKRTVNRNIGSKLYADASFYNTSGYIDEVRYERMTHNNTISGIDNTAANALLHSGLYRADNASGDTWIFADDLDLGRWGIYHDLANNNIDFYGNGIVLARVGLYNGGFYSRYNITTSSDVVADGDIRAKGNDVYIGSASGSQCHQQYDPTNKVLKFLFD